MMADSSGFQRWLKRVPDEELSGMQLEFSGCWAIDAPAWDAELAFLHLHLLLEAEACLYLEGGEHSEEVAAFVGSHQIDPQAPIARGTIWPRQSVQHLPATREVLEGLAGLATQHATPEICEHLVGYRPDCVLVDWCDAFDREVYASAAIAETSVQRFAAALGAEYRVEAT